MLIALLLAVSLPQPPAAVAELTFFDETGSLVVQVTRDQCWTGMGLPGDADPQLQQDPIHTGLVPKLEKRAGSVTCLWVGYRPGTHEALGDTMLTYALLLEGDGQAVQTVRGVWYEDDREIPRIWYKATGSIKHHQIAISLSSSDGAPPATITGVISTGPATKH